MSELKSILDEVFPTDTDSPLVNMFNDSMRRFMFGGTKKVPKIGDTCPVCNHKVKVHELLTSTYIGCMC